MVGDQHTDAPVFQEGNDALDLDHGDRVDAGKGLVKQDESWLRRQRARNFNPPAFTTRQGQRRGVAQMVHAQVLQQGGQAFLDLGSVQCLSLLVMLQFQHGAHIVCHVEFAENGRLLWQITQAQARAPVDRHVFDRFTVNRDVARAGAHQSDNHVERGGLAGAVGSEQTHHFALAHGQRDVLDDLAAAVEFLQVMRFEATLGRCVGCCHGSETGLALGIVQVGAAAK
ncbi:MAG: hypothetical protein RLZZ371_980 [Pseudomonadota bacterium]